MGHTLLCELGLILLFTLLCSGHAEDAVLTTDPNWSTVFIGESVTFKCDVEEGEEGHWEYKINKNGQTFVPYNSHKTYKLDIKSKGNSGKYQCAARHKSSGNTEDSNTIHLTVLDKPTATLTADKTTTSVGGSVKLTCSLEGSVGWTFEWFRRVPGSTEAPVEKHDGENKVVNVLQGGIYRCRGLRGKPPFYSDISKEVTVDITYSNKAVLTRQPDWNQLFSGERIKLTCEVQGGEGTEWVYEWRRTGSDTLPTHSNFWDFSVSESSSGQYKCKTRRRDDPYSSTEWSKAITLSVSPRPKAELSANMRAIPVGGNVTLVCSVNPASSGWKYSWFRDEELSRPLKPEDAVFYSNEQIIVSQEGTYRCRAERGEPVYYTEDSDPLSIDKNVPNKAAVSLQPNWTQIYEGEKISVRCEIQGGDTEWGYKWKAPDSNKPSNQHEYRISSASSSHSGAYSCKGYMNNEHTTTEWSDPVRLTVSDIKPRPVLTVSPSWLSPGASVTLSCEVEHPPAGWRFYWYKAVPGLSKNSWSYSYELLPGSTDGTAQDSYIIHGQTHTAAYVCRAGRGDPEYHSDYSHPKFVWSAGFHPAASLTVNPDRVQHFTSESVSLTCEGNSAEWRVKLFTDKNILFDCSSVGTMKGSTCNAHIKWSGNGVYWCESGSAFSNAVNITGQSQCKLFQHHSLLFRNCFTDKEVVMVSPAHPVTEGTSVSLGCRLRTEKVVSNVFFYKNDKLIQSDTRGELNISAVSKADEGFYRCQRSGHESPQSWMAVKSVTRPESSLFLTLLIVGLVCGILLLILLLLLLCRYKHSKDSCFVRSQSTTAEHTINQDEAQRSPHTSSPQGDVSVYETIKEPENTEHGESSDVTYSLIELKSATKKGKKQKPVESCVYSDVKIRSSAGQPAPAAAADGAVYAEVKQRTDQ